MFGLAIAGLIASVVGTGAQLVEAGKAAKVQEEQREMEDAANKARLQAQKQSLARQAKIKKAQQLQRAQALHTSESSGALGSQGALLTNVGGAMASEAGRYTTAGTLSSLNQRIAGINRQAQLWGSAEAFGQRMISLSADISAAKKAQAMQKQAAIDLGSYQV